MSTNRDPLGLETQLWAAADGLRGNVDASEYKHVVLGLLFLKYISDAFEELHERFSAEEGADPEDKDEYLADRVFWVPQEARWRLLQDDARQPTIGTTIDDAMLAIERENPGLRGVLPRDYGREALDKRRYRSPVGRNDRAVQGEGVRPMLRLGRYVCPVRAVRGGAWR